MSILKYSLILAALGLCADAAVAGEGATPKKETLRITDGSEGKQIVPYKGGDSKAIVPHTGGSSRESKAIDPHSGSDSKNGKAIVPAGASSSAVVPAGSSDRSLVPAGAPASFGEYAKKHADTNEFSKEDAEELAEIVKKECKSNQCRKNGRNDVPRVQACSRLYKHVFAHTNSEIRRTVFKRGKLATTCKTIELEYWLATQRGEKITHIGGASKHPNPDGRVLN